MSTKAKPFASLRGHYGRRSLRKHIVEEWNKHADAGHKRPSGEPFKRIDDSKELPRKLPADFKEGKMPPGPVCIIGAGVAGLYLGYTIQKYNRENPTQTIEYEILEGSNRIGGRLYTKHFPGPTPHNYYDAGAMRIPGLKSMEFVVAFMEELGVPLADYGYSANNTPDLYFNTDDFNTTGIDKLFDMAMQPFMTMIEQALETEDWEHAMEQLFKITEPWSTRNWLAQELNWPQSQINMAEMLNTSTGNFDQALTETVIDYYDFNNASELRWFRAEGGMVEFAKALESYSSVYIRPFRHVTDITYDERIQNTPMEVTWETNGQAQSKRYATVFCTTSLPCLQHINPFGPLDNPSLGIQLSQNQQIAIRSLHYDLSVKVAIKFTESWWIQDCQIGTVAPHGGSGSTDLPIRTVVYPSWYDGPGVPAVLLASYTWSQDSTRIGALAKDPVALRRQVVEDLARLHYPVNQIITPKFLEDRIMSIDICDWNTDPYTGGAFALFGPSQFQVLYPSITTPAANGRFHICGEHASAHHAWIAGSMSSVIQALAIYANTHRANTLVDWLDKLEFKGKEGVVRLLDTIDEIELGSNGTSHLLAELGKAGYKHEKLERADKSQKPPRHHPVRF
ncbi:hypothetical protein TWF694_010163 [Orbilia ellipsospora]|uniref:Amine oxidase domain-containing protein n=1 Tax=Orbilia ellipsospora TaxID=2528407 RepID=A0AAV9X919_9PEZI